MEKPIRRTNVELKQNNFVDYLFATYEPKKNSAGEYFPSVLDYTTNETSYLSSETEKEFIEEHGFAPIGFLEALRIQISKTSGFGICINNKDLKKALASIAIDYGIEQDELQKYYNLLLEYQLIIIISDSKGTQFATTPQQVFNWEYKMWSRWTNNQYQKKKRGTLVTKAEQAVDEAENSEAKNKEITAETDACIEEFVECTPGGSMDEEAPDRPPILSEEANSFDEFMKDYDTNNEEFFG